MYNNAYLLLIYMYTNRFDILLVSIEFKFQCIFEQNISKLNIWTTRV